jgi:uncharacterized integral membrane protein
MKTKVVIIILLIVLLIIFVLQNTEIVMVKLFFWELSLPVALLLFVCLAMGLLIGLLIPTSRKKEEKNSEL